MAIEQLAWVTFEQFLAHEAANEGGLIKHELVGGRMFAMAGGTIRHSSCIVRVITALFGAADAEGCRMAQGDVLVRVGDSAYYPDVMVTCGEQVHQRYETGPCLLAEVLSPSTEATDRREKFAAYQSMPTVQAYLLVDHERLEVTAYQRTGVTWTKQVVSAGGSIELRCPAMTLAFDDLFRNLPG